MGEVVNFPSALRGKATIILPEGDMPPDFKRRLYVAMTALLDVHDVEIERVGGLLRNAANQEIAMFNIDVTCNSPCDFNWVDQVIADSDATA